MLYSSFLNTRNLWIILVAVSKFVEVELSFLQIKNRLNSNRYFWQVGLWGIVVVRLLLDLVVLCPLVWTVMLQFRITLNPSLYSIFLHSYMHMTISEFRCLLRKRISIFGLKRYKFTKHTFWKKWLMKQIQCNLFCMAFFITFDIDIDV